MWENVLESNRPQITIWRMCIAWRILKAANTHTHTHTHKHARTPTHKHTHTNTHTHTRKHKHTHTHTRTHTHTHTHTHTRTRTHTHTHTHTHMKATRRSWTLGSPHARTQPNMPAGLNPQNCTVSLERRTRRMTPGMWHPVLWCNYLYRLRENLTALSCGHSYCWLISVGVINKVLVVAIVAVRLLCEAAGCEDAGKRSDIAPLIRNIGTICSTTARFTFRSFCHR